MYMYPLLHLRGIHLLIFSLQVRSSDGPISLFGNFLFWLMVADVLYRAATKENPEAAAAAAGSTAESGSSGDNTTGTRASEGSGRRWRFGRARGGGGGGGSGGQSTAMVTFEDAVMKRHTPRE